MAIIFLRIPKNLNLKNKIIKYFHILVKNKTN